MKTIKSFTSLFKTNKSFFKYLLKYGKPFFALQLFSVLLGAVCSILTTYLSKYFVDYILVYRNLTVAFGLVLIVFAFQMSNVLLSQFVTIKKNFTLDVVKTKVKEDVIKKVVSQYLSCYDNPEKLDQLHRTQAYVNYGGVMLFDTCVAIASTILSLCAMTYISFSFDWWLWIIIIGVAILRLIISNLVKKKDNEYLKAKSIRDRKTGYFYSTSMNIGMLSEIKIYNLTNFFVSKYEKSAAENRKEAYVHGKKVLRYSLVDNLLEVSFNIICYLIIGIRLFNNECTMGDYVLFFSLTSQLSQLISGITCHFVSIYEQILLCKFYKDFMDDELYDIPRIPPKNQFNAVYSVNFKNVTFSYPGQNKNVLDHINLSVKKGDFITVVGENGAGKTTLIKLLLNLYTPTSGEILVNDIPLKLYNAEQYWERVSVIFQNYRGYSLTVAENIAFSKAKSDRDRVISSLEGVNLLKKFSQSEKGIDANLTRTFDGEGIELSGGEWQKIAMARLYFKNADIWVLDEPSSALDAKSEEELYRYVKAMSKNKIVFFISHRLSSVILSNRIIFLQNGKIIADGTHNELMQKCQEYREMYNLQADRFINESEINRRENDFS